MAVGSDAAAPAEAQINRQWERVRGTDEGSDAVPTRGVQLGGTGFYRTNNILPLRRLLLNVEVFVGLG